jgi:hypothetical protein
VQQVQVQQTTPGGPVVVTNVPTGVPQTNAEYRALMSKRSELSDQLISAANRRKNLADQLRTADPDARPGIQARMKVLDDRIVRLETEIDRTGDLVANAPPHVLSGTSIDPQQLANRITSDLVPIVGMLSVFVLLPFTIAIARFIWKRAGAPPRVAAVDQATQQRLEQMSQAIDTIAIEVERISEGQRFVTRLLSDREHSALGAGAADPMRAPKKSAVPSERG